LEDEERNKDHEMYAPKELKKYIEKQEKAAAKERAAMEKAAGKDVTGDEGAVAV
jgi:hypothetical protein